MDHERQELISLNCTGCSTVLCISTNSFVEVSHQYSTAEDVNLFSHPGIEAYGRRFGGLYELEGLKVRRLICSTCDLGVGELCVKVGIGGNGWMRYVGSPSIAYLRY